MPAPMTRWIHSSKLAGLPWATVLATLASIRPVRHLICGSGRRAGGQQRRGAARRSRARILREGQEGSTGGGTLRGCLEWLRAGHRPDGGVGDEQGVSRGAAVT